MSFSGCRSFLLGCVVALVVGSAPVVVSAQFRCTMPSGVKITQQLGMCPRDAVAAEKLDGTPVPLAEAQAPRADAAKVRPAQTANPVVPAAEPSGLPLGAWLLVVGLVVGLVMAIKGSTGVSGPAMYCTTCGAEGPGKTKARGSMLVEIVLWCFFLVPGLIYSVWRIGSKHKVCLTCGASSLVPLKSPVAQRARAAAAPAPQVQKTPTVERVKSAQSPEAFDAWEGSFYDAPVQRSAKKTVRIVYRDGNGALSERVVDVRAFEPGGADGLLIGRCHLRNAMRTFRFDRLVRVVDEDTGEIIQNLQAVLNAEWEASPEPVMDALFSKHRDLLKMLLFAAKADGAIRAPEVRVIARHCEELTGDARLTPAMVRELLDVLDVPSITSFVRIYNRLRRERPADAERAAQACRQIVDTQKTVHPTEQAMLDALNKPLPKSPGNAAAGVPIGT